MSKSLSQWLNFHVQASEVMKAIHQASELSNSRVSLLTKLVSKVFEMTIRHARGNDTMYKSIRTTLGKSI